MIKCYFRNLDNNKIFSLKFDNPYEKNKFLTKCRYSKRIRYLGEGANVWV